MALIYEIKYMSQVDEVLKRFDEFETSMKTHLGKVDPTLIVDLLLRQKKEKTTRIQYTLLRSS
jgi:hypothetical protein